MTASPSIPHLRQTKTSHQLIVNGHPFLLLSAELHNSTLSSAEYMSDTKIWQNMKAMHINTLLGSVSWEQIEPTEGHFDFSNLDAVITSARQHNMKLVLLWFGSFKNARSTYVPGWVKRDVKRFPRVHVRDDAAGNGRRKKTVELLSPFCKECWEADGRAFARLMRHLKEVDENENTVLMVQVQNEAGMLGDSRDRSKVADEMFEQCVPRELALWLVNRYESLHSDFRKRFPVLNEKDVRNSTWTQFFGRGTVVNAEEIFMADAFSRYIEHVAAAGRAEYALPLFINTWMNLSDSDTRRLSNENIPIVAGGGTEAGTYPSGGPVPHVMDIYKYNAPTIDFISPDSYLNDYEKTCRDYRHGGQPLFIPEQRRDEYGARRIFSAYANHLALGCSPFGIDSSSAANCPFTKYYRLVHALRHRILEAQAQRPEDMFGFYFDEYNDTGPRKTKDEEIWAKTLGRWEVKVTRAFVFGTPGPGAGMLIHQGDGQFLCLGWGYSVEFASMNSRSTFTGILHVEEKEVVDAETGELRTMRWLGGDETRSGSSLVMPNEDPDYGGFPIAVTIPARTGIAECWVYSLEEGEDDD